jgi:serine/threonine protein kinase
VNHTGEQKKYVAKKVVLEGLGAKEQEGCMLEAGLLKNLDHPNIVGYKESFLGNNSLIIIMEYCDGKSASSLLLTKSFKMFSRRYCLPHQEEAGEGREIYRARNLPLVRSNLFGA